MEITVKMTVFLKVSGIHPLYILVLQVYRLLAFGDWQQ